ncbi:hypothetical protein P2318_05155 [Myxococcaceae bacterium GXIMD 01537]
MPMRYFDLAPDMTVPGRWSLGMLKDRQGRELENPWIFNRGEPIPDPGSLLLPVSVSGRALDLNYGGIGTPVVHARVAALLAELAPEDVQAFPVEVVGQPEHFRILVATQLIRCIDERASRHVRRWTPEDGRPEKVGKYRDVRGMRIDPTQVGDAKVFRPWGWAIALIVSEDIKEALERMGATGMEFQEV